MLWSAKKIPFLLVSCLVILASSGSALAAGFVPCGGPGERECDICFFFLMVERVVTFLLYPVAPILAGLGFALAGFYFLASEGNPKTLAKGKKIALITLGGFGIVFAGWALVNTFFYSIGVTDASNLKTNWWKISVRCPGPEVTIYTCGDGHVTGGEECDPNETISVCQGRTGYSVDHCELVISRCQPSACKIYPPITDEEIQETNGTGNDVADETAVATLECSEDKDKLGLGCYLDENSNGAIDEAECKKGKYVCIPETKKLACVNVFGGEEYTKDKYQTADYQPKKDYTGRDGFYLTDYCCASVHAGTVRVGETQALDPHTKTGEIDSITGLDEYTDGMIGDKPFTIVKATPADIHLTNNAALYIGGLFGDVNLDTHTNIGGESVFPGGLKGGYNCDEVCKKYGKICIGVGLTDPSKDACVYETHDAATLLWDPKCNVNAQVMSARLSPNSGLNSCKAYYGFAYYSWNNVHWSAAYDKYEYFCGRWDHYFGLSEPGSDFRDQIATGRNISINEPEVPDDSCGICKPRAAAGEKCTGTNYKQDPTDSCAFHGTDLGETDCYCY